MKKKQLQFSVWYFIIGFLILVTLQDQFFARHVETLSYSEFKILLKTAKLDDIFVSEKLIAGKLDVEGIDKLLPKPRAETIAKLAPGEHRFVTTRVEDADLVKDLQAASVRFSGQVQSEWLKTILSWIVPALVFFALWSFLMKRMGGAHGGMLEIGKSKARVYMEKDVKVTFEDVAGVEEAKEELKEIVDYLKNPTSYGRLGARIPKGVLLVGPPGTGKTLLARAVAGEAGVPFFSISGSEFVEMFVGVGAARVRDLFEQAQQKAPAIIFIDELDAVGRARGAYGIGGHDEKEQTLNQLLSELDGFDPRSGLVLLAATNRPEVLDPALLRAGRFDRQVLVDRPDKMGRIQILNVHLKKIQLGVDVAPEKIAALTPGFSGADLANLVNEAALLATRHNAQFVTLDDFTQAIERIVAGLEKKNRLLNPHERKVVAYHEMGHALVAMSLPGADPVHKISIIPRGIGALGYTIQRPTEDRFLMTRKELENKMAVLLGGRAAEKIIFEQVSTGAADDLAKVTDIARSIVMRYGMHETLGQVSYADERSPFLEPALALPRERQYSEETTREIDCAVREIIAAAFKHATVILTRNRNVLETGAQQLLEKETLTEDHLVQLREPLDVEESTAPR